MTQPIADFSQLTVIIPTLNEAENIGALVSQLAECYPAAQVLVIDDCSIDGTQSRVTAVRDSSHDMSSRVRLIERCGAETPGLTASVIDGVRACRTEFFVVMDGDLQHPVSAVGELHAALAEGNELVVAARLPYRERQPLHRTAFTLFAKTAARTALRCAGVRLVDPMSGFFGGRTPAIRRLIDAHEDCFELRGYKVLFDLLRTPARALKTKEVFYHFGVRAGGHSKLRALHAWCFLRSLRPASARRSVSARHAPYPAPALPSPQRPLP